MFNLVVLVSLSCVVGRGMATVLELNSPEDGFVGSSSGGINGISLGADPGFPPDVVSSVDPSFTSGILSSVGTFSTNSGLQLDSDVNSGLLGADPGLSSIGVTSVDSLPQFLSSPIQTDLTLLNSDALSGFGSGITSSLLGLNSPLGSSRRVLFPYIRKPYRYTRHKSYYVVPKMSYGRHKRISYRPRPYRYHKRIVQIPKRTY